MPLFDATTSACPSRLFPQSSSRTPPSCNSQSEQQPSANQPSTPVEPQAADAEPQSVAPRRAVPPREPTPRHPYRVYGYKLDNEWFTKFAKDHNIGKPHWGPGGIESGVLGYLTLRLPGFQIHSVDNPLDTDFGYSICICLATNWNRKKLERAASRVPIWMEILGTEEKPRWYKPTVETIPPMFSPLRADLSFFQSWKEVV
ncbi:hypothetical protein V8E55_003588 [Tylopilus felleus]